MIRRYTSILMGALVYCNVLPQYTTKYDCSTAETQEIINIPNAIKNIVPSLEGTTKGDGGTIGVIGGSPEYIRAVYLTGISALKTGADHVYVITSASVAPFIQFYGPDLLVRPIFHRELFDEIKSLLPILDVIVIGPGWGSDTTHKLDCLLVQDIISNCKFLRKPLVVDAGGLLALSRNVSILKDYPSPGAILTPNFREAEVLKNNTSNADNWYGYWGRNVSLLAKGVEDHFYSGFDTMNWSFSEPGSPRRVSGQGDILAGILATLYAWALKADLCAQHQAETAKSLAALAASRMTRVCNHKAFELRGRSMLASDMVEEIHYAFEHVMLVV